MEKSSSKAEGYFWKNNIDINDNIDKQIQEGNFDDKSLYAPIIYNIRLILQLRNAITKKDSNGKIIESHDFISCPACGFHSEKNVSELQKRYIGKKALNLMAMLMVRIILPEKEGLFWKRYQNFQKNLEIWVWCKIKI